MTLKSLRQHKNMSQKEASDYLGIPLRTYKRYENEGRYQNNIKYNLFFQSIKCHIKNDKKNTLFKHKLKVTVVGAGYVGLSLACLLSRQNDVSIVDVAEGKINLINKGVSPFKDELIERFLYNKPHFKAFLSSKETYIDADIVIIATPTNFDKETNWFDTSSIENVISLIKSVNNNATIVIKSTVPLGYTDSLIKKYNYDKILFSPEFLREGQALYDNLHPSRIIVGSNEKAVKEAKLFANMLLNCSIDKNTPILLMNNHEAEAVKLFSNAYLAMRVSFFNELDTYAETKDINSNNIIKGISLDPRIGNMYNNPSFGYGGYCLPKDTEQLANSFLDIPNNNLIKAIVQSNSTRKEYVAKEIISNAVRISGKSKEDIVVGVYLLSMKSNSDNHRSSSTVDIINLLIEEGFKTVVYDPNYEGAEKYFDKFISECDYYIANRYDKKLKSVKPKLYTRDLFNRD